MTFVDTNIFLRFLLKDNDPQHKEAKELFRSGAAGKVDLFTSVVVFFEIYWVLSSFYEKNRNEIIPILKNILKMEFISLAERSVLEKALALFKENNISLEDAFNLAYARARKAAEFKTFDKKLCKLFYGK